MVAQRVFQIPVELGAGPKSYGIGIVRQGRFREPTFHDSYKLIPDPDELPESGDLIVIWHRGQGRPRLKRLAISLPNHPIRPDGANDEFSAVVVVARQGFRKEIMLMIDTSTARSVDKVIGSTPS